MTNLTPGPNGQSPQVYQQNRKDAGIDPSVQTPADILNNPSAAIAAGLQSLIGITPARAGKAIHQSLVTLAGVLVIILGFILVVGGTKAARTIVAKAGEVAAIA
jgi:hypothetical protein